MRLDRRARAAAGPVPAAEPAQTLAPGASRHRAVGWRDPWVWLIAFAVFAAYTLISVARFLRLDPGSWDLGIYTEYVRQISRLRPPTVAIRGPGYNLLGDHFQPIVALLAPFFRLFPTPVTLLVAQALLTAVSVVPVCRAAGELLSPGVARAVGAAYGFSWGLQQMIDFDFHEVAFAAPLLAFSLSALLRRRPWAGAGWALPLVFVKEDQGLTVAAIGLVMTGAAVRAGLRGRPGTTRWAGHAGPVPVRAPSPGAWAGAGAVLVLWGLGWSALAVTVIIPHFNPAHHYPYWSDGGVLSPGGRPSVAGLAAQFGADGAAKLRTLALILVPTAFLALGSPLSLAAAPGLALRFLSVNSSFWGDRYHYNAAAMPIVFLAAVDTLARVHAAAPAHAWPLGGAAGAWARRLARARLPAAAAAAMLAIAAALATRFPLAALWRPSAYSAGAHIRAEYEAMARVPAGVTVETTLSTLATLAARDNASWVGTPGGGPPPRYIVFDAADSGYAPAPTDIGAFVALQHNGTRYQRIFLASHVYVFRLVGRTSR